MEKSLRPNTSSSLLRYFTRFGKILMRLID